MVCFQVNVWISSNLDLVDTHFCYLAPNLPAVNGRRQQPQRPESAEGWRIHDATRQKTVAVSFSRDFMAYI